MSTIIPKPVVTLVAILLLTSTSILAQTSCAEATSIATLNANNVSTDLLNAGDLWWDLTDAAYTVPDTGFAGPIFSGALWIGGIDNSGQLRIAAQTYRQSGNDFWPGPIDSGTGDVAGGDCAEYDTHWSVTRSEIYNHQTLATPIGLADIAPAILTWPALGNPYAEGPLGSITVSEELAPFTDTDGDGIYDPTMGDYPNVPGDQAVFWVFNDVGNLHTETGGQALGLEVRALAYAYASTEAAINNATFYRYYIVNKQSYPLDSVYIAHYVDTDLGAYDDDFVGCDTTRNLAIGYNGDAVDGPTSPNYGSDIPIVGIDLLKGALTSNGGSTRSKLTSFIAYDNDFSARGNPEVAVDYWRYMKGYWKDGTSLTIGGNGYGGTTSTKFMYPDKPDLPLPAWSECAEGNSPFDRRSVMGTGPLTMAPGYESSIDFAVIWTQQDSTQTGCAANFEAIFHTEAIVQEFFDSLICTGAYSDELSLGLFDRFDDQIELDLYPNPVAASTTLQWTYPRSGEMIIRLSNMVGQELRLLQLHSMGGQTETATINAEDLEGGVYLLTLEFDGKTIGATKLIK